MSPPVVSYVRVLARRSSQNKPSTFNAQLALLSRTGTARCSRAICARGLRLAQKRLARDAVTWFKLARKQTQIQGVSS